MTGTNVNVPKKPPRMVFILMLANVALSTARKQSRAFVPLQLADDEKSEANGKKKNIPSLARDIIEQSLGSVSSSTRVIKGPTVGIVSAYPY